MLYEISYMSAKGIPSIIHVNADSSEQAKAYFSARGDFHNAEFCGIREGASTSRPGVPSMTVPANWQPHKIEAAAEAEVNEEHTMNAHELDTMIDQIRNLKRLIEEAEAEITSIEDTIKAKMTELDTDELRGDASKVTWKQTSTTRIDSKALKKELPDIAAKYSSTTTYRRFLIA